MTLSDKIDAFWDWFIENESAIRRGIEQDINSESIVENLNNLILDIGAFSWEIGPGNLKSWYLTISPNQNKDLLKLSRQLIESGPNHIEWELNYSKPAKEWDRKFVVYDDLMNEQSIDATTWNYIALEVQDNMTELIIEASNIQHLDNETALSAADLVVLREIGEEVKMNKICSIEIVSSLDGQYVSKRTSIEHLKNHFFDF